MKSRALSSADWHGLAKHYDVISFVSNSQKRKMVDQEASTST